MKLNLSVFVLGIFAAQVATAQLPGEMVGDWMPVKHVCESTGNEIKVNQSEAPHFTMTSDNMMIFDYFFLARIQYFADRGVMILHYNDLQKDEMQLQVNQENKDELKLTYWLDRKNPGKCGVGQFETLVLRRMTFQETVAAESGSESSESGSGVLKPKPSKVPCSAYKDRFLRLRQNLIESNPKDTSYRSWLKENMTIMVDSEVRCLSRRKI